VGAAWTSTVASKSVAKAMALWKEIIVKKDKEEDEEGKKKKRKTCCLYAAQKNTEHVRWTVWKTCFY
jgi:hypothetical protein